MCWLAEQFVAVVSLNCAHIKVAEYLHVHVELPQPVQKEEPFPRCLGDDVSVMAPGVVLTDD